MKRAEERRLKRGGKRAASTPGDVLRIRAYLDARTREWSQAQPLPFLEDVWNLPRLFDKDDARFVQYARQGAEMVALGNAHKSMLLNGFGRIPLRVEAAPRGV